MHIHIPDGVLPIWLWVFGYFVTAVFLLFVIPRLKKEHKKIPLIGMLIAVVLLVMLVPLGLPIHLNLLVLIGIMVGYWWSLVIAFVVNFILASFGHGGLTIVGLNTILLWSQAFVGLFLFQCFKKFIKGASIAAAIATFISLSFSFILLIGVVAASQIDPVQFSHHLEHLGYVQISLTTFIFLSLPIAVWGILVESFVTGFIVNFIKKVKPELIE